MKLKILRHARLRMSERNVTEDQVVEVLTQPDLTRPGNKPGRTVYERNIGMVVTVVTVDKTNPRKVVSVWAKDR